MSKHILLVSQYFDPEQFRVNDICEEWTKKGYRVTVLTGKPNYPEGKYYHGYGFLKKRKETLRGAEVIRLPLIPRGKKSIMLALNYASFLIAGFFWSTFTRLRADVVFIYQMSPVTQAYPGVWFAKRRKIPCHLYVMDLWPESFSVMSGIHSPAVLRPLERMVRSIYHRSNKIFLSSQGFKNSVVKHGAEREKLVYWPQYAEEFYRPVSAEDADASEIICDGRFNVLFAGNIGQAQGLGVLPKTAELLRQKGCSVRFCLVGDGSYRQELQKQVQEYGLEEFFQFIGRQPAEQIPDFMAKCHASLVSLSKSNIFALTLPAKVQSSMACGKPIVVCADGEAQRTVLEAEAGVCADAQDAEGLAEQLERLVQLPPEQLAQMGKNSRKYFEQHFAKSKLINEMDNYLN